MYFSPNTTMRIKASRGYVVGYLLWVEWSLQRDADGIAEVSDAEDYEGADLAPGEASDWYHGHTLLYLLPLLTRCCRRAVPWWDCKQRSGSDHCLSLEYLSVTLDPRV